MRRAVKKSYQSRLFATVFFRTGLRLELPINPGSFSPFAHIRLLRRGLRQGSKGVITNFFAKGPGNIGFVTANIIYQIAIYVGETARTSYWVRTGDDEEDLEL
jgi:hypothetical protein